MPVPLSPSGLCSMSPSQVCFPLPCYLKLQHITPACLTPHIVLCFIFAYLPNILIYNNHILIFYHCWCAPLHVHCIPNA
jgi:hypothetical protein